ncbi:MAG: hypothetical protein AB1696_11560 [Planctomycetota bacterium]
MSRRVLRGRPSDHPYLHKDFHGALSFALDYVEERMGREALHDLLARVAQAIYSSLIDKAREKGLSAMREHLCEMFSKEGGEFQVRCEGDELVFRVQKCPALSHMRDRGYRVARRFCETTRVVNETIARQVGWRASVEYDQERGACVQCFLVVHKERP